MSELQSAAARGKKRRRRTTDIAQPRDFGGYGRLKCAVCGEPITKHKSMEFCKGKKVKE